MAFGCLACLRGTHDSCHARSTLLIEISSLDSFSGVLENVLGCKPPFEYSKLAEKKQGRFTSYVTVLCRAVLNLGAAGAAL